VELAGGDGAVLQMMAADDGDAARLMKFIREAVETHSCTPTGRTAS
jgi:hypothetical protein